MNPDQFRKLYLAVTALAVFIVFVLSIDRGYIVTKSSLNQPAIGGIVLVSLEKQHAGAQPTHEHSTTPAAHKHPTTPGVSVSSSPEVFTEPMVVGLSYWEQTGNALNSMFNLQCWASSVNITKVLQPAIVSFRSYSTFQFALSASMTFEDLFNISQWNTMSSKRNYSTLVPMNYFVTHAAKKVVYVHIKYKWSPVSCVTISKRVKDYLPKNGFRLVKSVCVDFVHSQGNVLSEAEFQDLIFKGIGHDVTLIFNEWRGIRDKQRVALKGRKCRGCLSSMTSASFSDNKPSVVTYVPKSSTSAIVVSQHILSYINRFVNEHLSGERYIAIMMRTEKIKPPKMSGSLEKNSCANGILSDWKSMAEQNNITKTLLFSDTGKHGSTGWQSAGTAGRFAKYIQDTAHVYVTPDKMNSILEQITGSKNSVQIALLHQQLVAHATCVVMVGGGTFQAQTLNQYAQLHKGHECYSFKLGECTTHRYMTEIHGRDL